MIPATVAEAARELGAVLDSAPSNLGSISDADAERPRAAGKWSRKQILGHLIDSASNNHQRFVRASLDGDLNFPGYAQEGWVDLQGYAERPWARIVGLWTEYNRQLLHIVERIPADRLAASCVVGGKAPVTLEFLVRDYVRHLEHHLDQVLDT